MRPLPPNLQTRLLDAASTCRPIVEARVETAADIRQRPDQWVLADGGLPTNMETLADGGVRLKATAGAAVGPTTVTNAATFYRAFEIGIVAPYIDPLAPDGRNRIAILSSWQGTQAAVSYGSVQAWLNPRFDTTKPKFVQTWGVDIFRIQTAKQQFGTGTGWVLMPVASAQAQATGEVAGWVVFTFTDASGKSLPFHPDPFTTPSASLQQVVTTQYLVLVKGYDAKGNPATNIGWGYDNAHNNFVAGSGENTITLAGNVLAFPTNATGTQQYAVTNFGVANIPAFQFIPVTYAAATTITFKTAHPIDLGGTPSVPPEFVVRAELPAGTSITAQAANDPSGGFVTYKDGQTADVLGLATQQKYDVQVTLTPSTAGDRTPILRAVGARVVTRTDLGDVADVVGWQEHTDPITHKSEVEQCTIRVLHDGERDYRDAISLLLSQNAPAKFYFRIYIGDRNLSRDQWLHVDDFFPDDEQLNDAYVDLPCVSCLSLLRQALPVLRSDAVAVPVSDQSNPGAWTASTGTSLFPQIADVAADLSGGLPDDTTYIQSPSNPSNADYFANLGVLSTPQQTVGATIQFRAAVAAGGQSLTLTVFLREGTTIRATKAVTVNVADAGQGSYTPFQYLLTAAEQASIGNWGNLNFQIRANGTGQIRVGWARLVVLGLRSPLVYNPNTSVQTAKDDLITSQVALDARYRGPKYTDPSPALPVAKTIAQQASSSTDLTKAKTELDALDWIGGWCDFSSQGRLVSRPLYQITTSTDLVTGSVTAIYSPLVGPIRAIFPSEEIDPLSVTPGWRQRIPLFAIPYGWNGQTYQGEAQVTNAPALSFYGQSLIDPEVRCPTEVAQWIQGDGVARGLSIRHSQSFGLGLMEWRFRTTYPRPELERGDVVVVQTDRFLAYDPIAQRAIAGKVWATGVISGRFDVMGREWSVWIQSLTAIRPISSVLAVPTINPQHPLSLGVSGYVGEAAGTTAGDNFNVFWAGTPAVASVKIAVGTTPPAAGSGTLFVGNSGSALITGPFAFGTTQFVTITPYATVNASDAPGVAAVVAKLIDGSSISTPFNPQGSLLPISTGSSSGVLGFNTGGASTISGHMPFGWQLAANTTLYRPDGTTITIQATGNTDKPSAPTLSQVAGGALGARTFQVVVAFVKDGMIYPRSGNSSLAVSANNLLKVTSPTAASGFDGWCVGCTTGTNGNQVLQGTLNGATTALIPFGTDFTEPVGGAANSFASATPIALVQQANFILATDLTASTTYWWYACFDTILGDLRFAPFGNGHAFLTAQSAQRAASVNGDTLYGLSFTGVSQATPGAGLTASGNLFTPKYQ